MHAPHNVVRCLLVVALAITGTAAFAGGTKVSYGGRLVSSTHQPITGPVDLEFKFFDAVTAGNPLGPTKTFPNVVLTNGVFQVELELTPAERAAVFGSGSTVYVQVKDKDHNKTYPRQAFSAVPYALRVPVDGVTLDYNGDGELAVQSVSGVSNNTVSLDGGANDVVLQAAAGSGAVTLTLPPNAGANNQVLTTDGAGVLTWSPKASGAGNMDTSTYDQTGPTDGIIDVGAGGTGADLDATGGAGNYVKQLSAGGALSVGTIAASDLPSGIDAAKVGLGSVQDVNVLNTFTQNNSQYVATDEIRARDSGGLKLYEDGGAGIFVEDSTGDVGIGTATPGSKVHVSHAADVNVLVEATSAASDATLTLKKGSVQNSRAAIRFQNTPGATWNLGLLHDGSTGQETFTISTGLSMAGSQFALTPAGSVGIGTTTPGSALTLDAKLHVLGSGTGVAGRTAVVVQNATSDSAAQFAAYNSAGQAVQIQAGGPTYFSGQVGSLGTAGGLPLALTTDGDVATGGSSPMAFATGGYSAANERMRITSTGNVGVGTASPISRLHVGGTSPHTAATNYYGVTNNQTIDVTTGSGPVPLLLGLHNAVKLDSSSNDPDVSRFDGIYSRIDLLAGYGGTITEMASIYSESPTITAPNKVTSLALLRGGAVTNAANQNSGNTSGTISNSGLALASFTAEAGVGGTLNNYGIHMTIPNGSGAAGTTNNYGIYLQGNSVAGDANYSLFNASTSPSYFAGAVEVAGQVKITSGIPGAGKLLVSDAAGVGTWQTVSTHRTYCGSTAATFDGLAVGGYAGAAATCAVTAGCAANARICSQNDIFETRVNGLPVPTLESWIVGINGSGLKDCGAWTSTSNNGVTALDDPANGKVEIGSGSCASAYRIACCD